YHFEQAGLAEKAVTYLAQAGQQAFRLSAYQEAIQLFTRALPLLATLPDTPSRAQQELDLLVPLGRATQFMSHLGSRESHKIYLRADALARQLGDDQALFAVLHGRFGGALEYTVALAIAEQLLKVAEQQPNPIFRVSAHHLMGNTLLMMG